MNARSARSPIDRRRSCRPFLVLVAHYDDETLFCGGTLLKYREWMSSLTIVVATNIATTSGPRECVEAPSFEEQERRLSRLNAFGDVCTELEATPQHLDVDNLPQIPTPNASTIRQTASLILERFLEHVQLNPSYTIITHGLNGEYGHPQHQAVAGAVIGLGGGFETLSFASEQDYTHRTKVQQTQKMRLLDRYRDTGQPDRLWLPQHDLRLSAWTGSYEWFKKTPADQ